jgi:hypothetical protein
MRLCVSFSALAGWLRGGQTRRGPVPPRDYVEGFAPDNPRELEGIQLKAIRLRGPRRNPIGTPNSVWARTPADNTLGDRDLDCRDRARRSLSVWLDQADAQFSATFDRTGALC